MRIPSKTTKKTHRHEFSLRSRRLEVAGERENGRARGRHARGTRVNLFFFILLQSKTYKAHQYFLGPRAPFL